MKVEEGQKNKNRKKHKERGASEIHEINEGPPERVLSDCLAHVGHQGQLQDKRDAACGDGEGALDHVERSKEHCDAAADKAEGGRYQAVRASDGVYGILVAEPYVQRPFEEQVDLSYWCDDASPQAAEFSFFSRRHKCVTVLFLCDIVFVT